MRRQEKQTKSGGEPIAAASAPTTTCANGCVMALLFFAATTALECATHDDCAVNQYCDDTAHEAPCAASGKVGVFNVSAGVLQPSEGLHFTYQRTETSVESTIRSLNDSAFNISGNVRVVGTAQSDAWSVHYDLSIEPASGGAGALAACAAGSCGLRIHSGDSCADAGNHWYPSAMADPWSTTTYAAQMRGSFIVDLGGAAGFTWSDLVGRVVIVDSASGGEHAACGIIGAQEFTTVEFVLEKPEEIAPQLHAQTSALLGWLHSGISGSFTVDVHNPGNIQSGALSAGNPNCPITNGAPVYPDAMKCTRCPTGAKQFWCVQCSHPLCSTPPFMPSSHLQVPQQGGILPVQGGRVRGFRGLLVMVSERGAGAVYGCARGDEFLSCPGRLWRRHRPPCVGRNGRGCSFAARGWQLDAV